MRRPGGVFRGRVGIGEKGEGKEVRRRGLRRRKEYIERIGAETYRGRRVGREAN